MINWIELLDQAMLGTQGANPPTGAWAGLTPEQALLKQFALAGAARRAGVMAQAVRTPPTIDPAPPETLRPCSGLALDWLKKVERTTYTHELIRDWCLVMIDRRRRVPHTALPYVLNLAIKPKSPWIPYLLPLVGERGRWLIERNEQYAALRQTDLWTPEATSDLKPAEIPETNKMLIDLRSQMMEGLDHE
jgi:hypothetical protein